MNIVLKKFIFNIFMHFLCQYLYLFLLGVEDVCMLTGDEINAPTTFLVFVNGLIIGAHAKPIILVDKVINS